MQLMALYFLPNWQLSFNQKNQGRQSPPLTALRRVLLKNRRLVRKKKIFPLQPALLF